MHYPERTKVEKSRQWEAEKWFGNQLWPMSVSGKKALSEGRQDIYVTGFTKLSIQFPSLPNHSIVRCTEDFMGREWYDFVVVKIGEKLPWGFPICGPPCPCAFYFNEFLFWAERILHTPIQVGKLRLHYNGQSGEPNRAAACFSWLRDWINERFSCSSPEASLGCLFQPWYQEC